MRTAEAILTIIQDRGKRNLKLDGIYRQLYNPDLYLRAYGRLYRNDGSMTPGTTEETVDGMSMKKIQDIIELLRNERYHWTPVRRLMIPKGNGKSRPLGIPTWSDKMLQEVMRSLMEAYYEPRFNPSSHGFRPERGCHTALREVFFNWTGSKWYIEGDIKGCFDNIDHAILLTTLREHITDNRFLILVERLLKAGYLEQWKYRPTPSGTPQGGIISPLLANIYLDQLDQFVETTLIPEYTKGDIRRINPEYKRAHGRYQYHKKKGAPESILAPLRKVIRQTPNVDPNDPGYRRLRYIRYADDFLLGFNGPRDEAEEIKGRLKEFLRDRLKLELSPEKTLITNAFSGKANFLGYNIGGDGPRRTTTLRIPIQKLLEKVARYSEAGKPVHRAYMIHNSDFAIVEQYGREYRGIVQYYAYARNRWWLHHLHYVMRFSLLKTLAAKHKTSVKKMAERHGAWTISSNGKIKCLQVIINRDGREPLYARFGGISLTMENFGETDIEDIVETDGSTNHRTELVTRLLAEECERCGSKEDLEVHHIRKLADLKVQGRGELAAWRQQMIAMNRKTLIVCKHCHDAIHAGRPTRTRKVQDV
jgi:group II intron reverse transcriptase/maturase